MSLNWQDERYIRVYTRDTTHWSVGPWEARAVLAPIMRKLDRAGVLELGDEGLEALAVVIAMPLPVVTIGLRWWISKGTFELSADGVLVAPNFLDAQESTASDAKRSREKRERARDLARVHPRLGAPVDTKRDGRDTSPSTTPSAAPSDGPADATATPAVGGSIDTTRDDVATKRDAPSRNVSEVTRGDTPNLPCRAEPSVPNHAEQRDPLVLTAEPIAVEGSGSKKLRKAPRHTPDQIAAKDQILEAFSLAFEAAKGVKPTLDHAADHAAAFALAAKYGADEGSSIVRRALTDAWVLEHNPTLRHIASRPDAWRGTAPVAKTNGNQGSDYVGTARKERWQVEKDKRLARSRPQHSHDGSPAPHEADEDALVWRLPNEAAEGGSNGS